MDPGEDTRPPAIPNVGNSCYLSAALQVILTSLRCQGLNAVPGMGGGSSGIARALEEVVGSNLAASCWAAAVRQLADKVLNASGGGPGEEQ